MNKKHWNTVMLDGSVPDKEVQLWIDHSYDLISGKRQILLRIADCGFISVTPL